MSGTSSALTKLYPSAMRIGTMYFTIASVFP